MISPALQFNGDCKEAIALYTRAFQATDTHAQMYDEAPDSSELNPGGVRDGQVMHASMSIYGAQINLCDATDPVVPGNQICLNVFVPSADDVKRAHDALAEEGRVEVPLGPQFFSPMYAAVVDKFGIRWQIIA